MKKAILTGLTSLIVLVTVMNSSTCFAGDKEWATAGKILTGVVAAQVVGDVLWSDRHITVKSYGYKPYHHRGSWKKRYYHKNRGSSCGVRKNRRPGYCKIPRPKVSYRPIRKCTGPVIVHLENGRRIYQPRIKGATAYLQVYSRACNEWVTLEEYPSIW